MTIADVVPSATIARERTPLRVVLAGWYGAANLGDELLLSVIAGWVREAGGVPVAISTNPGPTHAAHGIEAVGYGDLAAIVEAMAGADLFVLGGGGLFQDYDVFDAASLERFPAWTVSQYAQFMLLADELGLPTVALAQGVGPLRGAEARAIAADIFTRAGDVSVRDRDSAALVRDIGVTRDVMVAPDPGWTWRHELQPKVALRERYPALARQRVIAMILRDWPFDPAWEAACVEALRAAIPAGWAVLWLDFNRPPDAATSGYSEIARRMVAALADGRTHVIWAGTLLEEAAALLAQCDACIAMRLHGVLLAALAGVPVIAIEYDGKVAALCDEIGMAPAQRVGLPAIRSELARAIAALTGANGTEVRRLAPARVEQLGTQALAHRDLLWRAMASAQNRSSVAPSRAEQPAWLGRWLEATPAAVSRVEAALGARLRRHAAQSAGATPSQAAYDATVTPSQAAHDTAATPSQAAHDDAATQAQTATSAAATHSGGH